MYKLCLMPGDTGACGMFRIINPSALLKLKGIAEIPDPQRDWYMKDLRFGDITVIQRSYDKDLLAALPAIREGGREVVYECDDQLWNIHPTNPAYPAYTKDKEHRITINKFLKQVDRITTTTPELANEFLKFNKNVFIVPNYIDYGLRDWTPKSEYNEDKCVIYYGFSTSHALDLTKFMPTMEIICQKYKYKSVVFRLQSNPEMIDYVLGNWKIPADKVDIVSYVDFKDYPQTVDGDIAIAPLHHSEFNACKSGLKLLESAARGIATIGESWYPYIHLEQDKMPCRLANTTDEWVDQISDLIDNPDKRIQMGKDAAKWCITNADLHDHIEDYINAWYGKSVPAKEIKYNKGRNELCNCGSGKKIKNCHESW